MSIPRIRLYVVDPHAVTRAGLHFLFRADANVYVVGDSSTTVHLHSSAVALPHVVLSEVASESSLRDVETLLATHPALKVIAFTDRRGDTRVHRFVRAGGAAYVLKTAPSFDGLIRAVRAAAAGNHCFDPWVAPVLARVARAGALSAQELTVLRLIVSGETQGDIAALLAVSVRTVETYRERGIEKLDVHSRVELVEHARREGWFDAAS